MGVVLQVSPASDSYDETLSTLRYANRAKQIKNKPTVNEDPKDAKLREYQDEISKLKALLAQAAGGNLDLEALSSLSSGQILPTGTSQSEGSGNISKEQLEAERKEREEMKSIQDKELNQLKQQMEDEKQRSSQWQQAHVTLLSQLQNTETEVAEVKAQLEEAQVYSGDLLKARQKLQRDAKVRLETSQADKAKVFLASLSLSHTTSHLL